MTALCIPNNNFRVELGYAPAPGQDSINLPVGTLNAYNAQYPIPFAVPTYMTLFSAGIAVVDDDANQEIVKVNTYVIGGGVDGGDLLNLASPTVKTHSGLTYCDGEVVAQYFTDLQGAAITGITASGAVSFTAAGPGNATATTALTITWPDTGAANAYVVAPSPAYGANPTNAVLVFVAENANTGASTLTVNGHTAALTKQGAVTLSGGEVLAGQAVPVAWDGSRWQIIGGGGSGGGTLSLTGEVTGTQVGSSIATTITLPVALGSSTATTQSASDNSTKLATTAYADAGATAAQSAAETFATSAASTAQSNAETFATAADVTVLSTAESYTTAQLAAYTGTSLLVTVGALSTGSLAAGFTAFAHTFISDWATAVQASQITYSADGTSLTLTGTVFSVDTAWPGQSAIVTVGTLTAGAIGVGFTSVAPIHGGTGGTSGTVFSGLRKAQSTGADVVAVAGTDYTTPGNVTSTLANIDFLTVGNDSATYSDSRQIAASPGISITDGGAGSTLNVGLTLNPPTAILSGPCPPIAIQRKMRLRRGYYADDPLALINARRTYL